MALEIFAVIGIVAVFFLCMYGLVCLLSID